MKNIAILAGLLFFLQIQLFASDVTITATDAVTPPGNNGSITIDIDPAITSVPFIIAITGPGGFSQVATIFSHSLTIAGLKPGIYCVNVLNAEGCETNSCVEVRNCYLQERGGMDFYLCNAKPETCCDETALFMLGNPVQFNDSGIPVTFEFGTKHNLTIETLNTVLDSIYSTTMGEVDQIVSTGYSEHEIPEQSEIISDAMFILKFNQAGELIWVYHNYLTPGFFGQNQNFDTTNTIITLSPDSYTLFPNPSNESISVRINFIKEEDVICRILNIENKVLLLERKSLKKGVNLLNFNIQDIPPGIYFLSFLYEDGTVQIEKFFKT